MISRPAATLGQISRPAPVLGGSWSRRLEATQAMLWRLEGEAERLEFEKRSEAD